MLAQIVLVEQMLGRREKLRVACHAGNLFDHRSMAACLGSIGAPCERPMATHKRSRYGPRPSPERSDLASPKPAAWFRDRAPPHKLAHGSSCPSKDTASVIILEKVGIPEPETSGNALEGLRQRIFRAAENAVLPNGRGTQIEEADIGRAANAGRFCLAWFRP